MVLSEEFMDLSVELVDLLSGVRPLLCQTFCKRVSLLCRNFRTLTLCFGADHICSLILHSEPRGDFPLPIFGLLEALGCSDLVGTGGDILRLSYLLLPFSFLKTYLAIRKAQLLLERC